METLVFSWISGKSCYRFNHLSCCWINVLVQLLHILYTWEKLLENSSCNMAYFGCWIIWLWATWTITALKLSCVSAVLTPKQSKRSRSSHPRQQPLAKQWTRDHAQTDWYNIRESNIKSGETVFTKYDCSCKGLCQLKRKIPMVLQSLGQYPTNRLPFSSCYFGDSGGTLTSGPYAAQARNSVQKAANTSLDTPSASAPISSTKVYFIEQSSLLHLWIEQSVHLRESLCEV